MSNLAEDRSFWLLAIFAAILVVYLPGLNSDLIFDDQRLMDGTIFGPYGGLADLKQRLFSYGSFVWIHAWVGENWPVQRFFNLLIHAGTASLLFQFVHALLVEFKLPESGSGNSIEARSINAAVGTGVLLFAINPVSVYAVAYLIQRSILMATFFGMSSLYLVLLAAKRRRLTLMVPAAIAYVMALLSKEHAVLLPIVALSLYLMVRRPGKTGAMVLIATGLGLAGVGAIFLLQRYESADILGKAFDVYGKRYVEQLEILSPGIEEKVYPLSILNQTWLFARYGFLWFVPNTWWMSLDLRPAFPTSFASFPQVLGVALYLGALGGSLYLMIKFSDWRRLLGFALFAPSILFASEFATVWVQDPFVLYRSYLWAAVGFPLLVAMIFVAWPFRKIVIGSVVLSLIFGGLAVERVFSLKTEFAAWQDAAAKVDLNDAPNAVGRWRPLLNRGNQYLTKGMFLQALADYEMAARLGENSGLADYHRGTVLQQLGRFPDALAALTDAERDTSKNPSAYLIPLQKGNLLSKMGRFEEAVVAIDKALPALVDGENRKDALTIRAQSNVRLGNFAAAINDYRQILALIPEDRKTSIELAIAYGMDNRLVEAMAMADRLLAGRDGADIRFARALILSRLGKTPEALTEARLALQFKPGDPSLQGLVRKLQAGS